MSRPAETVAGSEVEGKARNDPEREEGVTETVETMEEADAGLAVGREVETTAGAGLVVAGMAAVATAEVVAMVVERVPANSAASLAVAKAAAAVETVAVGSAEGEVEVTAACSVATLVVGKAVEAGKTAAGSGAVVAAETTMAATVAG